MGEVQATVQQLQNELAAALQRVPDEQRGQRHETPERGEMAELRDEIDEYQAAIRDYQQKIEACEAKFKELETAAELRRRQRKQQEDDKNLQLVLSKYMRDYRENQWTPTAAEPSSQPLEIDARPPIERDIEPDAAADIAARVSDRHDSVPVEEVLQEVVDEDKAPGSNDAESGAARPRRNRAQPHRFQDSLFGEDFRRAMEENDAEVTRGGGGAQSSAAGAPATRANRRNDAQDTGPVLHTMRKRSSRVDSTNAETSPRKRQKSARTRRTILFEDVFQGGRPDVKYYIVQTKPPENPPRWYILRCDKHDIDYGEQGALQRASRHVVSKDHCNSMVATQYDAIRELGIEVLGCNPSLAEKNNKMCQEAGPPPPTVSRTGRQQARSKRGRPPGTGADETGTRTRRRRRDRGPTPLDGDPVTGKVYLLFYNRTKTWYTGIRMPPGSFKVVGISGKFGKSGLQRSIPRCYDQEEGGKILKWAADYRDGGPKANDRIYPVLFFDDKMEIPLEGKFRLPKRNVLAWLASKHFREFDVNDEFSQEARGYQVARSFLDRLAALEETEQQQQHSQADHMDDDDDDSDDARSHAGDDSDDSSDDGSTNGNNDDENDDPTENGLLEPATRFEQDPLFFDDVNFDTDDDDSDVYIPHSPSNESERASIPPSLSPDRQGQADDRNTGHTPQPNTAGSPVDIEPLDTSLEPNALEVDSAPTSTTAQQALPESPDGGQSTEQPDAVVNTADDDGVDLGKEQNPNISDNHTVPEEPLDSRTREPSVPILGLGHSDGATAQQTDGEHRVFTPSPWDLAEAAFTAVSDQNPPPGPRQQADADSNGQDQSRRPRQEDPDPTRQESAPVAAVLAPRPQQTASVEHVLSNGLPSPAPDVLSPRVSGNGFTSIYDRFQAIRTTPATTTSTTSAQQSQERTNQSHQPVVMHTAAAILPEPTRSAASSAAVSQQQDYAQAVSQILPTLLPTAFATTPVSATAGQTNSATGVTGATTTATSKVDLASLFWRTARLQKETASGQATSTSTPTNLVTQQMTLPLPPPGSPPAPGGQARKASTDFLVPSDPAQNASARPFSSRAQTWPIRPPAMPQSRSTEPTVVPLGIHGSPELAFHAARSPTVASSASNPSPKPGLITPASFSASPPLASSNFHFPVEPQAVPIGPQPVSFQSSPKLGTGADLSAKSPCMWCLYIGKGEQCTKRNSSRPCRECERLGYDCIRPTIEHPQAHVGNGAVAPPTVGQPAVRPEAEDDDDVAAGDPESWKRSYLRKVNSIPTIESGSQQM